MENLMEWLEFILAVTLSAAVIVIGEFSKGKFTQMAKAKASHSPCLVEIWVNTAWLLGVVTVLAYIAITLWTGDGVIDPSLNKAMYIVGVIALLCAAVIIMAICKNYRDLTHPHPSVVDDYISWT